MDNNEIQDLISDLQVTNEDYQGFVLALSDMLGDCSDPINHPEFAFTALKRDCYAIAAICTALNKNARQQATMLDKLAEVNKDGDSDD